MKMLLLLLLPFAVSGQATLCQFTTLNAVAFDLNEDAPFDTSVFNIDWTADLAGWNDPGNVSHWSYQLLTAGDFSIALIESTPFCTTSVVYTLQVLPASATLNPSPICLSNGDQSQEVDGGLPVDGIYSINGEPVTFLTLGNIGDSLTYTVQNENGCWAEVSAILIGSQIHVPSILLGN